MKRVLILVVSVDSMPVYDNLYHKQRETWDAIEVEGVQTLFYFGGDKASTYKCLYTGHKEDYSTMGYKCLSAFSYALINCKFDYVFRANSSQYIDKKRLVDYCQNIPTENLALGLCTEGGKGFMWGGGGYIFSHDVIEKIVDNRSKWDHSVMEDVGVSKLCVDIGIPLTSKGVACSVDKNMNGYEFICYNNSKGGGCTVQDLAEMKTHPELVDQFCIRVKCDRNRAMDLILMDEFYSVFK